MSDFKLQYNCESCVRTNCNVMEFVDLVQIMVWNVKYEIRMANCDIGFEKFEWFESMLIFKCVEKNISMFELFTYETKMNAFADMKCVL